MKHFWVTIFYCLLKSGLTGAQPERLHFEHYNVSQGLASDQVSCIVKDSHGFMWFGTSNGLSRFDGSTFVNFKYRDNDSTSLSNNKVNGIHEDSKGNLWIATDRGLNRFNKKDETFTRYVVVEGKDDWLSNDMILSVVEDYAGSIWIATYGGGLNKYDPEINSFRSFVSQPDNSGSIRQNHMITLLVDSDSILWIGLAGRGLERFDPRTEVFTHYAYESGDQQADFRSNVIRRIQEYGDSLWVCTYNGLNVFDKVSGRYVGHYQRNQEDPNSLSSSSTFNIQKERTGNYWVATSSGLDYFDSKSKTVSARWKRDPDVIGSLKGQVTFDILRDPQGSIWVATMEGGVHRGHLGVKDFRLDVNKYSNSVKSTDVTNIEVIDEVIIASTAEGAFEYDRLSGTFLPMRGIAELPMSYYNRIIRDRKGRFWATSEQGLYNFDPEANKVAAYRYNKDDPESLGYDVTYDVLEDHLGNIWIATVGGGLNKYQAESNNFSKFRNNKDDTLSIISSRVYCLFQDRKDNLWVGTDLGLNKFNYREENFTRFFDSGGTEQAIGNNYVFDIHQDENGTLWVGTRVGLEEYSERGEPLRLYTEQDGLPSNEVWTIVGDLENNLWLGTGNGLCKFNPATNKFRVYDKTDGVPVNRFNLKSAALLQDGSILIGTREGILSFHPEKIVDNLIPPPVVITGFSVHGENQKIESRNVYEKVVLNHRESVFDIAYAALNYNISAKNQYAYQLEGFDDDWVAAGHRRFVTYTNLDAGKYRFRVRGSNNDGVWNEEGAFIDIEVLPPPWKTWWAYTTYILAAISMGWAFVHYRVKQAELKAHLRMEHLELEKMREVSQLKSRLVANISHEFRTPLTLILGPLKDYLSGRVKPSIDLKLFSMMHSNGLKLLGLINQMLDVAKLESGKASLKVTENNLVEHIRVVFANFTSLAAQRNINYRLDCEADEILLHFDSEAMEKVFNNLLSNAFKFTEAGGTIELTVKESPEFTVIAVSDSGIGIPTQQLKYIFDRFYQVDDSRTRKYQGTGIGLALAKELVELHHGELSVESVDGAGSTFTVRLLAGHSHFSASELDDSYTRRPEPEPDSLLVSDHRPEEVHEIDADASVVMIVEDNPDMRYYIKGIMDKKYKIIEAENGAIGLERAIESVPDMIITDVMMPEMDGFTFCQKLKADERTSHIPVIMLTAKADEENKVEGLGLGAEAYLTKPFNVDELAIRVERLIDLRQKLIQKYRKVVSAVPSEVTTESAEERFLRTALRNIELNISNEDFDVDSFARAMGFSRVQLYRKIKALTNLSTSELIRNIRIERAAQLLQKKEGTIAEIAYSVGFSNLSYFSKCFKEKFHRTPSEYMSRA